MSQLPDLLEVETISLGKPRKVMMYPTSCITGTDRGLDDYFIAGITGMLKCRAKDKETFLLAKEASKVPLTKECISHCHKLLEKMKKQHQSQRDVYVTHYGFPREVPY